MSVPAAEVRVISNAAQSCACDACLTVMITCLIVDDHAPFLEVARDLLESEGLSVVGVASTIGEGVRLARELQPDVALVDIDLGAESGFDLAQRLAELDDGPAVIFISTHSESEFPDLIAESPVAGFLPKADLSATAIQRLLAA